MTDEEIQIIRGRRQVDPPSWTQLHALADEALWRGEEIERLKEELVRITNDRDEWRRARLEILAPGDD